MTEEQSSIGGVANIAKLVLGGVPSLDWTVARLTGHWLKDGEMMSCPLPGHRDSSPSFNLWAEDATGIPQRFGCFGCGAGGDVVRLIALIENLDSTAAGARAAALRTEEQADTSERPKRSVRPEIPAENLEEVYGKIQDERSVHALSRFMQLKGISSEAFEVYAMEEWGWAGSGNRVVIPHRDREGKLTALKYRSLDRKKAVTGSRYPALYGAWRDHGHGDVVLCEGESDTLWAAWQLREKEFDVFGLPAGAEQGISPEWVEMLKDRRVIVLFDSDDAGMRAARRWCAARPDTLVGRLPEDEDVLSCGQPVSKLLETACSPRQSMGTVFVDYGVFCKPGRKPEDDNVALADFSFQPVRELVTPEGPAWEGFIPGERGLTILRSTDLLNGSTLSKWANKRGYAWAGGSGPTAQGLLSYMKSISAFLPLEQTTTRAGKIGRSYVGPDFCIGADRIRYIPPVLGDAKLSEKIKITEDAWDGKAIIALERMNDPAVMATVLGWLCATLIRGERAPAPPLFISGESGAGKTHLIETVLSAFGFNADVNLTTTTPYGVDCMISSTIGFPVWFDEYRGGAREDSMMRLRQLLRDAYNGQSSVKGGMTQQATELTEVKTWAGIVVSGEMGTQEVSLRDRMVMLDLEPDAKQRGPYEWLRTAGRTTGLGHALLTFLADRNDVLFRIVPTGPADQPDRFRDTLGFVNAGWEAWLEFRMRQGLTDTPVGPNWNHLAGLREDAADPWLEALRACAGVKDRSGHDIVEEVEGGYQIIPQEVVVEARRVGIELPARANELVTWLTRRYEVEDTRKFGRRMKVVKGLIL